MKQLLTGLLIAVPALFFAQKTTLTGTLQDTAGYAIPGASVMVLQQSDSVMAGFGQSDMEGHFAVKRLLPGTYILQVSVTGYQPLYRPWTIAPGGGTADAGLMRLFPAAQVLGGVDIVAERNPLRFRNDTLEYNSAAFQTQPGAVVEDLLKKLPGVEVQSDGTIRSQGEVVQNVLVDGKTFFGQDPKIATRNLPADVVDKVQVFDKKSDAATFTGIDDGQEEKTINLQLKEDAKAGWFGNISAGGGTENRYEGKGNTNRFTPGSQLSILGAANNTNQQAFSIDDYITMMGGLSNLMSGGGGGRIRLTLDDNTFGLPGSDGPGGNGFTDVASGGLNFNRDLSAKTGFSAHYFYSHIHNNSHRTATRFNTFNTGQYSSVEQEIRSNDNHNHRLNLQLESEWDTVNQITLRSRWNLNDARFATQSQRDNTTAEGALLSQSLRQYTSDGLVWRGDASLQYRRRLRKKAHALVADASFQGGNDRRNGHIVAENSFFEDTLPYSEYLRQRQRYDDAPSNWGASVRYSRPVARRFFQSEWRLSHRQYANESAKSFFDQWLQPQPGEVLNPALSNAFRRGYRYEQAAWSLMRNRKRYEFTGAVLLQQSVLTGRILESAQLPLNQQFVRLLPSLFYQFEPKTGRILRIEYETNLREPSLEQLLPVTDNSDPLQTYRGNPKLQPEYVHTLRAHWMYFDAFTNTLFMADANHDYTRHFIVQATSLDALFRTEIQPVNVPWDHRSETWLHFSRPVRPLRCKVQANADNSWNFSLLMVNGEQNRVLRRRHALSVGLENRKKDVVDLQGGVRWSYNHTAFASDAALNQSYQQVVYYGEMTVFPSKQWAIRTAMDYYHFGATDLGPARQIPLWKAEITRYVLKNRKGQIKLSGVDLLNRNTGLSRNSAWNYTEEVRTINLSRYFMLSFAYSMSGFGQAKNGIEIRRIGQ